MHYYKITKNGKTIGVHCGVDPIPKEEDGWTAITQEEYEELIKEDEHE